MVRVALGALAVVALSGASLAHPLHTTLTELESAGDSRAIRISIRVFADDLGAAVRRRNAAGAGPDHAVSDTAVLAYANATLTLTDRGGQRLAMSWCGSKRTADLIWLCLSASAPRGVVGARVEAQMLFELYPDQVNLVQVAQGSRRQMLLFTRGDGPK